MILSEPYPIKTHPDALRQGFFSLRGENVLVYWPHGIGDWVFLGLVLGLADKSNHYYVVRFGEDHLPIFENAPDNIHTVCVSEKPSPPHGCVNFPGIWQPGWSSLGTVDVSLPPSLHDLCVSKNINHVICDFPEVYNSGTYPFHTKARNQLRHFMNPEDPVLKAPIKNNCVSYDIPVDVEQRLEAYFRNETGYDKSKKLCLISRIGDSHIEKNWGHMHREETETQQESEEPMEFISLLKKDDPNWMFVSFERDKFTYPHTLKSEDNDCFASYDIFGSKKVLFIHVLKFLLKRCDLFVGVPTGLTMMASLSEDFPSISIWLGLFPSWYEEPKQNCTYMLNKTVQGNDSANSFLEKEGLIYNHIVTEGNIITGEEVMGVYKDNYA